MNYKKNIKFFVICITFIKQILKNYILNNLKIYIIYKTTIRRILVAKHNDSKL